MHSGTIQQGDTWLQQNISSYVTWAKTNNSLLILTFDEDNSTTPNQIPTVFVGEDVHSGIYPDYINHYNILRTIEDIYGLPPAGASGSVNPITNCWLTATGISNNSTPVEFKLGQNYPNPFNPVTKIKFEIPSIVNGELSIVNLKVFDLLGREVVTLVNEKLSAGNFEVEFDGSNLSSGIYFYRLEAGNFSETKRMILLK